jgi:hypothetical protein
MFAIIALSTPDWTVVAQDDSDSTDRPEYGNCELSGGEGNPNRDTCAKCMRSNSCGWNVPFSNCQRQVGAKGKKACAAKDWTCDRLQCAGMKSQKYGVFYYCEKQAVGDEIQSDFCAPLSSPTGFW